MRPEQQENLPRGGDAQVGSWQGFPLQARGKGTKKEIWHDRAHILLHLHQCLMEPLRPSLWTTGTTSCLWPKAACWQPRRSGREETQSGTIYASSSSLGGRTRRRMRKRSQVQESHWAAHPWPGGWPGDVLRRQQGQRRGPWLGPQGQKEGATQQGGLEEEEGIRRWGLWGQW